MVAADSFEAVFGDLASTAEGPSNKRQKRDDSSRESLRIYETLPPQMLNAYGMAGFHRMPHEKVWEEMSKPLKTGAKYMTELCSDNVERRGVGINRFEQTLVEFLKYQMSEVVKKQNELILRPEVFTKVYQEIEVVHDAAVYCLASKKTVEKTGAAGLRVSASQVESPNQKTSEELKKYSDILFRWLTLPTSRLRMLMQWQGAGGLPYVAYCHLLGVQCFMQFGNKYHEHIPGNSISHEEFQNCIVKRHQLHLQGDSHSAESQDLDFRPFEGSGSGS